MKGTVMSKKDTMTAKQTKSVTRGQERGIGVVELLFAVATIGAAVLISAMPASNTPALSGD